jgi:CDP-glycerol glycerophosphotransferase
MKWYFDELDKRKKIYKSYLKSNNIIEFILILCSKALYKLFIPVLKIVFAKLVRIRENRIVFMSSPDYSDNGRVLSEYLNENYEIIWLVDDPSSFAKFEKPNVKFIKASGRYHGYLTIEALYYANSANTVFFTHGFSKIYKNHNNRPLMINLWHGCGYKDNVRKKIKNFDYVLVPGKIFIETKSVFFGCSKDKILVLGYPRYDLFKRKSKKAKEFISQHISKRAADKIIIWLPTFRKGPHYMPENKIIFDFDLPVLSSIDEMYELDKRCRLAKTLIIIKKHRHQEDYKAQNINFSNILFVTDEKLDRKNIQLYEILPFTDALITDYSSVAIDYLLLDKPIGFTLDDFEKYKSIRGFVFDEPKKYMPGQHIYNLDDLFEFINNVSSGIDAYKLERKKIKALTHNETENYCDRICRFFDLVKEGD